MNILSSTFDRRKKKGKGRGYGLLITISAMMVLLCLSLPAHAECFGCNNFAVCNVHSNHFGFYTSNNNLASSKLVVDDFGNVFRVFNNGFIERINDFKNFKFNGVNNLSYQNLNFKFGNQFVSGYHNRGFKFPITNFGSSLHCGSSGFRY